MAEEALRLSGTAKGVYFTLNPLNADLLARAANRVKTAMKGDLATDADVVRRRWILVDVDPIRVGGVSATDSEKSKAWETTGRVRAYLTDLVWPSPAVADSGNGFHLLFRVDLPADDGGLVRGILEALAAQFDDGEVRIDVRVHNPSRVTKVYGTLARKGDSTTERPHRATAVLELPDSLEVVDERLLRNLLSARAPGDERHQRSSLACPPTPPRENSEAIRRERAYLAAVPPAISGKGGHDRTFEVACRLVRGFDLSPQDALPLLREWNQQCEPPWTEEELKHKLEEADAVQEPRARGYLLREEKPRAADERRDTSELPPLEGETFCASVPDFIPVDARRALGPLQCETLSPGPGRPPHEIAIATYWAMFLAVFQQRARTVVIPDLLLQQQIYGARSVRKRWKERFCVGDRKWPTLEQQRLARKRELEALIASTRGRLESGRSLSDQIERGLSREQLAAETELDELLHELLNGACRRECPLYGGGVRHQHFRFRLAWKVLGQLAQLASHPHEDDSYSIYFDAKDDRGRSILRRLMKQGDVYWAYLPVQLFGPSPRVGLSLSQIRLVQGLMRERVRRPGRGNHVGKDRAELVERGLVWAATGTAKVSCPLLDPGRRYVAFAGNGRRRGRGYALIGRTCRGWLHRAGYPVEADTPEVTWGYVRRFLADLRSLAEPLAAPSGNERPVLECIERKDLPLKPTNQQCIVFWCLVTKEHQDEKVHVSCCVDCHLGPGSQSKPPGPRQRSDLHPFREWPENRIPFCNGRSGGARRERRQLHSYYPLWNARAT